MLVLAGIGVSLSNPYFTGWWATVGAGQIATLDLRRFADYVVFWGGHEMGDVVWYTFVAALLVLVPFGRSPCPPLGGESFRARWYGLVPSEDQRVLVFDLPEELLALGDVKGLGDGRRQRHIERFVGRALNFLNSDGVAHDFSPMRCRSQDFSVGKISAQTGLLYLIST
jgi:hypothetical protein